MKSTEIIQKLLDEKKITAEEALCLLQDMTQPSIIQPQPTWTYPYNPGWTYPYNPGWTYPYNPGEVWCGSTTSTLQQVESSCCQCCNTKSEKIEEKQPNIITEGYVDLGLPSGTLWAACNVGADSSEETGGYYNNNDAQKLDCTLPNKEQIYELKNHTTYTWGSFNGHKGGIFTGKNGNSIFLPAAGYYDEIRRGGDSGYHGGLLYYGGSVGEYLSSSFSSDSGFPFSAYILDFNSDGVSWHHDDRNYSFSVRPIKNK